MEWLSPPPQSVGGGGSSVEATAIEEGLSSSSAAERWELAAAVGANHSTHMRAVRAFTGAGNSLDARLASPGSQADESEKAEVDDSAPETGPRTPSDGGEGGGGEGGGEGDSLEGGGAQGGGSGGKGGKSKRKSKRRGSKGKGGEVPMDG
eukprot:scaffold96187_cov56-Phaeocystis_antarctica.AAC.1